MNPDDPKFRELIYGDFSSALNLFEEISRKHGYIEPRCPEESSKASARSFAEGLLLDDLSAAKLRIAKDRSGARAFWNVAHEVDDYTRDPRTGWVDFELVSDGKHQPFMLVASAVLNWLDGKEN